MDEFVYNSAYTGAEIDAVINTVRRKEEAWDKGGEPGVGIASIEQTTTSTESGGENIITFTKTDGTVDTASVFNGARGEQGPAGRDGYLVHNAQIYSTEETVIGQWINGKPLYRKVFVATSLIGSADWQTIADVAGLEIDKVTKIEGIAISTNNVVVPMSYWRNAASYSTLSIGAAETDKLSVVLAGFSADVSVTLEYTKTTDEATIAIATVNELNAAYEEGVQAA